ncbi:hypothetical protein CV770_30540 [Bradyrhizobium sp. AC87j1]|nr:hypothetical protein CV770_30540 [Bradyrhizobium sp. AC87j1]
MVDSFRIFVRLILAEFVVVVAKAARKLRCHSPRKPGIQYAEAFRFNYNCLGVLDRPVEPGDDSCE